MIGKTIGNHQILGKLGEGGMGIVYKAEQMSLTRTVAMKILPQKLTGDSSFVQRFLNEARAIAALNHPNIVQIYDIGHEEDTYYYTMQFIDGTSVDDILLQRGNIPLDRAVNIVVRIAKALDYMHRRGIIHRDVKPSNIMIDKLGTVKLMDFGLALQERVERLTMDGGIVGTPEYMSPEQASGETATPQSDIYSLGVVFYELLTGAVPFNADTPLAVIRKIQNDEPVPPREINPEIPPGMEKIVLKMMAKDPHKRYSSCRGLIADLKKFKSGESVSTLLPGSFSAQRIALGVAMLLLFIAFLGGGTAYITKAVWKSIARPIEKKDGGEPDRKDEIKPVEERNGRGQEPAGTAPVKKDKEQLLRARTADWPGWEYSLPIAIDNTRHSSSLRDYQIRIDLDFSNFDFSKTRPRGEDIRFVDSSNASLSYWIENWNLIAEKAKIWVKIPSISDSSLQAIDLLYGNPSAGPESSGLATFEFFDDFTKDTLKLVTDEKGHKIAYEPIPKIPSENFEFVMKIETIRGHRGDRVGDTDAEVGYYICDTKSNNYLFAPYYTSYEQNAAYAGLMWFESGKQKVGKWSGVQYDDNHKSYTVKISHSRHKEFRQVTLDSNDSVIASITLADTSLFNPNQFKVYARDDFDRGGYIQHDAVNGLYKIYGIAWDTPGIEEWLHWLFVRKCTNPEPRVLVGKRAEVVRKPKGLAKTDKPKILDILSDNRAKKIEFEDGIRAPIGMVFSEEGNFLLIVSALKNGAVYKIDIANGKKKDVSRFAANSRFGFLQYIAVDPNGFVFVAPSNSVGNGLFRISPDGSRIDEIGKGGNDTRGLAFNSNADLFSCNLICYSSQGFQKAYITKFDLDVDSQLRRQANIITGLDPRPIDLVFDSQDNLFYAADEILKKVTFNTRGGISSKETFARLPTNDPSGTCASSIGIDNKDNIYVGQLNVHSDTGGTVFKVDPRGNVSTLASGFNQPRDICADSKGNIYISDYKANKIFRVTMN